MFKYKPPQREQGFTLVEVLVAILIVTTFVTVTMQALVIAAIFKVRGQEYAAATSWIQDSLEPVKLQAAKLRLAKLTAAMATTNTVLSVTSVDGFAAGDALMVGTDSTSNIIQSVDTTAKTITLTAALGTAQTVGAVVVPTTKYTTLTLAAAASTPTLVVKSVSDFVTGDQLKIGTETSLKGITAIVPLTKTITLNAGLAQAHAAGDTVVAIPTYCNASASTSGFAYALQQLLPAKVSGSSSVAVTINGTSMNFDLIADKLGSSTTSNIKSGKNYRVLRNTAITATAPYNVLEINYAVVPETSTTPIAVLQTQVIPDAAFYCPQ
ncbi:MAG: prepilin-type N-terminal cleavage/methylation domain-containing protein [Aphanothece sp. CMT-3BRIN-NPC111]|jgi:prepilin-type N-terminal cleavage/methylation domain-containing protein|nr:prepilin-type N-terminal cleavage/methylation domain-containing protein [Aphanothece sp. CMT-3BRIN-NPC111]